MKKILIILAAIVVIGVGYYLISPAFIDVEVNDEAPIASGSELLTPEERAEEERLMKESNEVSTPTMDEEMPSLAEGVEKIFKVMSTAGHPAKGNVRIIETEEGTVIRFEDFETINGPRLNLYLAKDLRANEFVDLGPIKGTSGNINYLVPEGIDISDYKYIMHWCVPFKVLFNYVDISEL